MERALQYMGLKPNTPLTDIKVDRIFIGSCTNARIEDLRAAAVVARGKRVDSSVKQAMVVPGSGLVKLQAEQIGRATVRPHITNAQIDLRISLETKKIITKEERSAL